MIYYKCTKDKRNARYIRDGSCLMVAPLTKNLKAREGIDHIVSNFIGSDPENWKQLKCKEL